MAVHEELMGTRLWGQIDEGQEGGAEEEGGAEGEGGG